MNAVHANSIFYEYIIPQTKNIMDSNTVLTQVRRFLFIIAIGVFAMTVTELIFLGHWNKWIQFMPFLVSVIGITTLAFVYFRPSRTNIIITYWTMIVIGICSFIGFYEHMSNNYQFWLEIQPNSTIWELIKATFEGENPVLAPGILLLGAAIGLVAIYRHPVSEEK